MKSETSPSATIRPERLIAGVLKKRAAQSHLSMRTEVLVDWRFAEGNAKGISYMRTRSGFGLDLPHVEEFGVTGRGYFNSSEASGAIERGADVFLCIRQNGEWDF